MGSKKKKIKDEIVVTFCGNQSEEVTGSATLISVLNEDGFTRTNVLVDIGMVQGKSVLEDYKNNRAMIENIPLKSIDYCILTDKHCDHLSNLPSLACNDKVRVITTETNYKIIKPMLLDSVFIHERNVEYLNSKGHRVRPLYVESDFWNIYSRIDTYTENDIHKLTDKISFQLLPNNHQIGANSVVLYIKKRSGAVKKIVVTGDLGNEAGKEIQYYCSDTVKVSNCDLYISEATYGNREPFTKKNLKQELKILEESIDKYIVKNRKSILIPVFSLNRLQTMMTIIYDMYKDKPTPFKIVVDTNLGNQINEVFLNVLKDEQLDRWAEVMKWDKFEFIRNYKQSVAFMSRNEPCLVLSSSGMVQSGRSTIWAEKILGQTGSLILTVGYCAEGTTGRDIQDENKTVIEVNGHTVLKRCDVIKLNCFSGHAQRSDLINNFKGLSNNAKIVLHHGDSSAKEELKRVAEEELRKMNKTNKIIITKKNMQITL